MYSLYFTDRLTGDGVGSNSTILKTLDGGSNWTVSFSNAKGELRSNFFADKENGYIAGSYGRILKTIDASKTWTSVSGIDTNIWLNSIYFPDYSTCCTGGGKMGSNGKIIILKSVDAVINLEYS
jgi:photosystem II stability/assembly factor-like uncharacterized protein